MKKILLISMSCLLLISTNAQEGKRFEYKPTQFGIYTVIPLFNQSKGEGKRGFPVVLDKMYINDLFYNPIKEVFSKEKLKAINLSSGFTIVFNAKGEILNCRFSLDSRDTNIILEDDLYNLYLKFKKIKIDMTKVRLEPGSYPSEDKVFDYGELGGSMLPKEYKDKYLKKK